jgi:transposase
LNVSERASQDCFCPKHLKLLSENARLKEEIARLKAKLARQERTAKEQPFGLSTPSSKQLVKPSLPELSEAEVKRRKGGARIGHAGHGWKEPEGPAPETEILPALEACPCCGGALESFPAEEENVRELIDCNPLPSFRRRVKVPTRYCPRCRKPVRPRIDGVLPKTRLTNNVMARVAAEHYFYGIPMGVVARRLNVAKGVLFNEMHRLAEILQPAADGLLMLLRGAAVKQADETSWRTDGDNGYAWVFIAGRITLFVCEQTRSSSVPSAVLSDCIGKLMTDRYAAYNCFNGDRGYCLEHLKRETLKIVVDNPKSKECLSFTTELVPWLCMAMSLRVDCAGDNVTYLLSAAFIRHKIEVIVEAPARHPAVQRIQNIFRENAERLWLWTTDPRMPADNNAAERAIRPLAIARKVSHGSMSVQGRKTRSVLMSVLHTLNACCTDPAGQLVKALNHYAQDRNANMFNRVFGGLPLYVPTQ